jgi:hypothetical protein
LTGAFAIVAISFYGETGYLPFWLNADS